MQKLNFLFLELLFIGAMVAVAQDARFHIDRSTEFSKYKTYKWLKTKGADHVMNPVDAQVVQALDAELVRKGLGKSDSDAVDLLFCYHSAVGTRTFSKYQSEWESACLPSRPTKWLSTCMILPRKSLFGETLGMSIPKPNHRTLQRLFRSS